MKYIYSYKRSRIKMIQLFKSNNKNQNPIKQFLKNSEEKFFTHLNHQLTVKVENSFSSNVQRLTILYVLTCAAYLRNLLKAAFPQSKDPGRGSTGSPDADLRCRVRTLQGNGEGRSPDSISVQSSDRNATLIQPKLKHPNRKDREMRCVCVYLVEVRTW